MGLDLFPRSLMKLYNRITELSGYSFESENIIWMTKKPRLWLCNVSYFFAYIWFLNPFLSALCHGGRNLVSPSSIALGISPGFQEASEVPLLLWILSQHLLVITGALHLSRDPVWRWGRKLDSLKILDAFLSGTKWGKPLCLCVFRECKWGTRL